MGQSGRRVGSKLDGKTGGLAHLLLGAAAVDGYFTVGRSPWSRSSAQPLGLRIGDPHEVLGAWLAKESVREVYLTDDPRAAALLLDKAIAGCAGDVVEEIRSFGNTLSSWRSEIWPTTTGASNGTPEGLNLCVKAREALRSRLQALRAPHASSSEPEEGPGAERARVADCDVSSGSGRADLSGSARRQLCGDDNRPATAVPQVFLPAEVILFAAFLAAFLRSYNQNLWIDHLFVGAAYLPR